jgi:hypothetical protein
VGVTPLPAFGESKADEPDCGPGLPNGISDYFIARDVNLALEIVYDFLPCDLVVVVLGNGSTTWTHPAKIAVLIAVEASRVAVLALDQVYQIWAECHMNAHQALLRQMDDVLQEVADKVEGTAIRQMESCLVERKALVSMCLPADQGGQLEEVFLLVDDAITKCECAGILGAPRARQYYRQAEFLYERGFYMPAYSNLCLAYNELACL